MTWRTMESAPRDGTRVLVRCEILLGAPRVRWSVCVAAYGPRTGWLTDGGDWLSDQAAPTHWMPLPSTDLTAPCPVVEARIQGMREGFVIAQEEAYAVERHHPVWDDADVALDAAIAELREGKR